jgi:hypothetical protein
VEEGVAGVLCRCNQLWPSNALHRAAKTGTSIPSRLDSFGQVIIYPSSSIAASGDQKSIVLASWLSARPDQNALGLQELINRRFWSVPLNTDPATRSLAKLSFPLVCKRTENPESGVPPLSAGHGDGEIGALCPWPGCRIGEFQRSKGFALPIGRSPTVRVWRGRRAGSSLISPPQVQPGFEPGRVLRELVGRGVGLVQRPARSGEQHEAAADATVECLVFEATRKRYAQTEFFSV